MCLALLSIRLRKLQSVVGLSPSVPCACHSYRQLWSAYLLWWFLAGGRRASYCNNQHIHAILSPSERNAGLSLTHTKILCELQPHWGVVAVLANICTAFSPKSRTKVARGGSCGCPENPLWTFNRAIGLPAQFSTPSLGRHGNSEETPALVPELFYLLIFHDHIRCYGF